MAIEISSKRSQINLEPFVQCVFYEWVDEEEIIEKRVSVWRRNEEIIEDQVLLFSLVELLELLLLVGVGLPRIGSRITIKIAVAKCK